MKPLSIRTSLTLWFVGLTGVLLAAFSATFYVGMRDTLVNELDARLLTRAEALVAFCEWEEDLQAVEFELTPEGAAEFARHGNGEGSGRGLEVRSFGDGKVLYASGGPFAWHAAGEPPPGATLGFLDGGEMRFCTVRKALPAPADVTPAPEVVTRVAESFAPVREQLRHVRGIIGLLTAVAAGVVMAFGFLLSRRFVRPLRELGSAAAAVDATGEARMPRRGSGDEVDRLAEILDRTFDSLRGALARKTRFTADAAHELRNPVSVIRSAAEVALKNGRSEREVRQFLHDILATSKRMGDIVQSLLTLARLDSKTSRLETDEVDLAAVVEEAVAASGGGDRISFASGAEARIRGERGLLRVLVDNLITNALRHSDGGEVEVAIGRGADDRVTLEIRDHGPGVPEAEQRDVFQRFYRARTTASRDGAGLGLAIVAEVALVHGATCAIENADPGARARVVFPARYRFRPHSGSISTIDPR